MRRVPERLLSYLTEVDGVNHVALVAIEFGVGVPPQGVGVGRFVRDPQNPTQAELALTVADRAQGRGIGRRLLSDLAKAATALGIETFTMSVISSNVPARRLLASVGAIGRGSAADVMQFHLPLKTLRAAA
jgi:GNAT superfamily N-acetyltransferase